MFYEIYLLKMDSNEIVKTLNTVVNISTIENMIKTPEEMKVVHAKIREQPVGPKSLLELSLQALRPVLTEKNLTKLSPDLIEKLKETIFRKFPVKTQIKLFSESKTYSEGNLTSCYHHNETGELDGICFDLILDGYIKSTNYKNGKKDGMYIERYNNGHLCETSLYKNGKLEGERREYHKNGELARVEFYRDGKLEGEGRVCDN